MFSNIKIIMAVDEAGGFGKNGKLPWHFKEDMAFFKTHTMGKCCVMGRKTYDEINSMVGERGKEKLLAGRVSWVLTRNTDIQLLNAKVVTSLKDITCREFFVIGGKALYNDALGYAGHLYLTRVAGHYNCDVSVSMSYINDHFSVVETYPSNTPELTFQYLKRNT